MTDGKLTFDDAKAIVDIVVGTDFNAANKGVVAKRINDLIKKNSDTIDIKKIDNLITNIPIFKVGNKQLGKKLRKHVLEILAEIQLVRRTEIE